MAADLEPLLTRAKSIRADILRSTTEAGSGHPSSSLSATEVVTALYFGGFLRYDPANPHWPDRDRFILSKGHAAPILYAALAEAGYFPKDQIMTLRKLGSPLEGHPNMTRLGGVEASTGSLGQGLSLGIGHALAARLDGHDFRVYVLLGDGEMQEGQVWEAVQVAARYRLDNLTAILDYNGLPQFGWPQAGGFTRETPIDDPGAKFRTFGWNVIECNGHDQASIREAFDASRTCTGQPTCVVAHTVKGQGVSFMEGDFNWHAKVPTDEQLAEALAELDAQLAAIGDVEAA